MLDPTSSTSAATVYNLKRNNALLTKGKTEEVT